jgi:hypothetical protein|tara:strand:- start:2117 stop:2374 length:258 start_codon:yes stop_codon:yes gene_type:complete
MEQPDEINLLKETILKLENELQETKDHLKKYTAPARNRNRYNPDKAKEYQTTVTTEKKKEYARRAYLNKKEKLKKENEKSTDVVI